MAETVAGPSGGVAAFRSAYADACRSFLDGDEERALRVAYELGRDALSRELGLLELAHLHHVVLQEEIARREPAAARRVVDAAGDFLSEALSAYEMARRGLSEAQKTVAFQRRQAAMIRRLSTLLADTSLAAHGRGSLLEMLRLVAEQARELVAVAWCVVHVRGGSAPIGEIAATAGQSTGEAEAIAARAYEALDAAPAQPDARLDLPAEAGEVIAVPLSTLDGRAFGVIVAAAGGGQQLTELDQAVVVHLAQMTSAALERALRYDPGRR